MAKIHGSCDSFLPTASCAAGTELIKSACVCGNGEKVGKFLKRNLMRLQYFGIFLSYIRCAYKYISGTNIFDKR